MTSVAEEHLDFAHELAEASGAIVRRYFRRPMELEWKPDATPVTPADREVEQRLRELVLRRFPAHGVLGEEFGAERAEAELVWVFDPIDGTRAFASGMPVFATLIALLRRGRPVLGLIDQPILRERWVGSAGRPTLHDGKPARCRNCERLEQAVLSTTTPEQFSAAERARFDALRGRTRETLYGGDAYAYGLVASGYRDLIVESGLKLWDWAALVPVLAGAGGSVTAWNGEELAGQGAARVLAAGSAALARDARAHLQLDEPPSASET